MRNTSLARLSGSLLASLVGALCVAQTPATHPCAAVTDDRERLACFDRAFAAPAAPGAAPTPAPPAQPAQAAQTEVKDEFGMSARRKLRETPGADKTANESITAVISKIDWRRGTFVVTLDNGQVWSQSELNSQLRLDPQETVTIRRAMLGSYLLTGKQGVATRVKRVK